MEPGYYWVKDTRNEYPKWEIARHLNETWRTFDGRIPFSEEECDEYIQIGPRIEPPERRA